MSRAGFRFPVALAAALVLTAGPARATDPSQVWRDTMVSSGPALGEEPPHPEAAHEWWFFTVQNPGGACGPWQAMASFVADREAVQDQLLLTTVVDGVSHNFSQEFSPGSLSRTSSEGTTTLSLGSSNANGAHSTWTVHAQTGGATLDLNLTPSDSTLWHRRAPEGGGALEITFEVKTAATGSLTIPGDKTCQVTGTGYVEHVWGNWSRVPAWGVDFLNAHLDGGWSAYARRTPMRGQAQFNQYFGLDGEKYWPPALIVSNGTDTFEARNVTFTMTEDPNTIDPQLRIPMPVEYEVRGTDFRSPAGAPSPPTAVVLEVTSPTLATIFFPTTSSGVLEGWGQASLTVDGVARAGTSEIELQRFGTTYPH